MKKVNCWECGKALGISFENPPRQYCPDCKPKVVQRVQQESAVWLRVSCRHLVDEALEELEDAGAEVFEYREAYDEVLKRVLAGPVRFSDVTSVKTALVLEYSGIEYKMLPRIMNHRADFFLPEMKLMLMVGSMMSEKDTTELAVWKMILPRTMGEDWVVVCIDGNELDLYQDDFEYRLEVLRKRTEENTKAESRPVSL